MDIAKNKRLQEIKLAVYINHIDKTKDKIHYKKLLGLLSCLALTFDGDSNRILANIVQNSVCDGLLNATDKEIVATQKAFLSQAKMASKLGITPNTYITRYKDLLSRDFINDDFINSLVPMYEDQKEQLVISIMNSFIERFKVPIGRNEHKLSTYRRTIELEFLIIYEKLLEIFRNSTMIDKFIFNICNMFYIDYSTIANLKNNIHIIGRQFPRGKYNGRYLRQELTTLYLEKGFSKCYILKNVLNASQNYFYQLKKCNVDMIISDEDLAWQYAPTIKWDSIDEVSARKFIRLFHDFVEYDI